MTKLVYRPRRWDEEIQLGDGSYNLWPGWGALPAPGDVTLWTELLAHVIPDERERRIFESWLAYPLQHPGTKMAWAVLIWSNEQGVGKSLIGELMSQIYGVSINAVELKTAEELLGTFNSWANRRRFITVVETHAPDSRAQLNKLKALITADQSRVNEKFKPEYSIDDRINYLFNSQYDDALPWRSATGAS